MKTTTTQTETPSAVPDIRPATFVAPQANIFETKDSYLVELEMPGVSKADVQITLDGSEITIIGKRANEVVSGDALLRERITADFRRVFELDPVIDTSRISAKAEQGIVTLTLPKSEKVKPRKISVGD